MNNPYTPRGSHWWLSLVFLLLGVTHLLYAQGSPDVLWARGGVLNQGTPLLVFSPDAQWLASSAKSYDRTYIKIWRHADQSLLRTVAVNGEVNRLTFSPDGTLLAAAVSDQMVYLWRTADGSLVQSLPNHSVNAYSVCFSHNGSLLASSGYNAIYLWRTSDFTLARTISGSYLEALSLDFSPDDLLLAAGNGDRSICIWRTSNGTLAHKLISHQGPVTSVAFSPSGTQLVSGSIDSTVRLWNLSNNGQVYSVPAPGDPSAVFFSPLGTAFASANANNVDVRRIADGQSVRTLWQGLTTAPIAVTFSPDWQWAAALAPSSAGGYQIERKQVDDGTALRPTSIYVSTINSVDISRDGRWLAAGGGELNVLRQPPVFIQDYTQGELITNIQDKPYWYDNPFVAFSPDNTKVAAGGDYVRVWNITNWNLLWRTNGSALAFSPDSRFIAIANGDTIGLYYSDTGTRIKIYTGYSGTVQAMAFSPDGLNLATSCSDKTVRLWRVMDGSPVLTINPLDTIRTLAWSPDGNHLALGGGGEASPPDYRVRIYLAQTGALWKSLDGHANQITALAYMPHTNLLASASYDGTLRFWDPATGTLLRWFDREIEQANCLAFAHDGRSFAFGRRDSAVIVARNPFGPDDHSTSLRFVTSSCACLPSGGFMVTLQGRPGSTVEIESSKDFALWTLASRKTNLTGQVIFTDITPANDRRFYRARQSY